MQFIDRSFSVIIPAFNEEKCLARTLDRVSRAREFLRDRDPRPVELLIVDNNSTDQTACIALNSEARVVSEPFHNIAKVRNTGAKAANGDTLVFIDADTLVPETLLWRISQTMSAPECAGGSVDTDYRAVRFAPRLYLQMWRIFGKLLGMAQGATQFCRRSIYESLGGYDETLYMGEDVEFYWRLQRTARKLGQKVSFLTDIRVTPSGRRFNQWPLWKTLIWTNPIIVLLLQRRREPWHGWYQSPPR